MTIPEDAVVASGVPAVAGAVRAGGFGLRYLEAGGRGLAERQDALASCRDVRFEDVAPVRSFRWAAGQCHFAGWYWSATTGRHVGFESWLERPVDRTNPGQAVFPVITRNH